MVNTYWSKTVVFAGDINVRVLSGTREREQLTDRIESLQQMLNDEKSERRQLTALLTDQREKPAEPTRKGLWARLVG